MAFSKKNVIWFNKVKAINEIYQEVDMKFSFVNTIDGKLHQCHQWVKCRDFLHDAVRTTITGEPSSIYGFTFDITENVPVNMNNISLLISYKSSKLWAQTRSQLSRGLRLINQVEKSVGNELSTIEKVKGDLDKKFYHVWMFNGPKMWLSCPYFVSLYTLLIRVGALKFSVGKSLSITIENIEKAIKSAKRTNDVKYLESTLKYLVNIVKDMESFVFYKKDNLSDVYFRETPILDFHNRSGIVSLCECSTPFKDVNDVVKKIMLKVDKKEI